MIIYITDKTGKKFWRTSVSSEFSKGERNNLTCHLRLIKSGNPAYGFIYSKSARIVEDMADELQHAPCP